MRCPYCNALNAERATFCSHCGRDLTKTQQSSQSQQPQNPSTRPTQLYSPPSSSTQPPYPQRPYTQPAPPVQTQSARPTQTRPTTVPPAQPAPATRPTQTTRVAEPVKAPELPAQFPPRTLEQLQALEPGAMPYTVVDEAIGNGRKRIVRISYRHCSAWQQVATLLKAFKEQSSGKYDTTIIQGVVTNTALPYAFNNGQFTFDRNVRLGSQLINRYVIETGTGLESDSLRIVLQDTRTS